MKRSIYPSPVLFMIILLFVVGCSSQLSVQPTSGPTLTADEQAHTLAEAGVTRSADWAPYTETFNEVEMALVPAGCFQMSSHDVGFLDLAYQPIHEVCFEQPFWIDVYEVTNGQYSSAAPVCMDVSSDDNQPRICINWTDAAAYCESRGARLPTEAEWEYAARGPDGLTYPWGNKFVQDNVVYDGNSGGHTWDVGSKPGGVSWIGAFDLSGNVWEWVNDWFGAYSSERQVNPQGPGSGDYRVARGGSWYHEDDPLASGFLYAVHRGTFSPSFELNRLGLRCARSY